VVTVCAIDAQITLQPGSQPELFRGGLIHSNANAKSSGITILTIFDAFTC
jgi:hypothetical protein